MRICTFASGSKGNCTLVSLGGKNFLVDAGISMKRICSNLAACALKPSDIDGIFITHQHSDHISGLEMLTKHYHIPVYAPRSTAVYLQVSLTCRNEMLNIFPAGSSLTIGNVFISSFATSHDTEESVGYRMEGDRVFAVATDTGIVTESVFNGLAGADIALIESNHDLEMLRFGPYPYPLKMRIISRKGHLSNDDCGHLAAKLADTGTKYIVLGHLSKENNTPARALGTVKSFLQDRNVKLFVAPEADRLSLELDGGLI